MCSLFILGSPAPLSVQSWNWDHEREIAVFKFGGSSDSLAIFSTRILYGIAAQHTGDGCGFSGNYKEADDARQALAVFVEHALDQVADLRLYVAYHDFGDTGVLPAKFDFIGPSDIRTWKAFFNNGDYYQLIRED